MRVTVPDFYEEFHCLAGACPHTCCEKWEVVIDGETARRYLEVPGLLGQRLRAALQTDSDGDQCFALSGGRCPFLNGENLCAIHCALGQQATSVTCREHPRFTEDYGPFREITLSASCPEANRLLLSGNAPLDFHSTETDEPGEEGDAWLPGLLALRARLIGLLQDRAHPLRARLWSFLSVAAAAQARLDEEEPEEAAAVPALPLVPAEEGVFPAALDFLAGLECLDADWPQLLAAAAEERGGGAEEALLERIAVYFAFRYLLKAVNDGDVLARAEFTVFAVLTVERLAGVCGLAEGLRRFSAEIEHDEDNLNALLDALRWDFGVERLAAELAL